MSNPWGEICGPLASGWESQLYFVCRPQESTSNLPLWHLWCRLSFFMFVLTIFCCFGATVVFTFKRIVKVIRYQKIHQLSIHCFIQVSEGLRGTGIFGIFIALWILNYFKAPQWRLEKIGKLFEKNYENYQYYIFIEINCLIIIVFVFKNVLIFWQQINKLMQLSCLRITHIWGQSISMASAVFGLNPSQVKN